MKFSLLLVEDDVEFSAELRGFLSRYGITVSCVENMSNVETSIEKFSPDIIILDQFVGGHDSILSIPSIRLKFDGSIVVYTGNSNLIDRIVALECGADEFISKTCDLRELVARLRAVLRRAASPKAPRSNTRAPLPPASTIWEFDAKRGTVKTPTEVVLRMTSMEFDFLTLMQENAGRLVTRELISDKILRRKFTPLDRSIDNMLSHIRGLLMPHMDGESPFRSVRGRGYVFVGLHTADGAANPAPSK